MTNQTTPKVTADPTTPYDHALAYAALGLRVVPIARGRKHPPLDNWQRLATDNPTIIAEWWQTWADAGVGLALGDQPYGRHLFAIDLDVSNGRDGFADLEQLETKHSQLDETWLAVTGSGGAHAIFAAPAGVVVRNQQAHGNRLAPGIDVRGQGGQIVVAPTVHASTGVPYRWEIAPWDCEVAEAPEWLTQLVADGPRCPCCGSWMVH